MGSWGYTLLEGASRCGDSQASSSDWIDLSIRTCRALPRGLRLVSYKVSFAPEISLSPVPASFFLFLQEIPHTAFWARQLAVLEQTVVTLWPVLMEVSLFVPSKVLQKT